MRRICKRRNELLPMNSTTDSRPYHRRWSNDDAHQWQQHCGDCQGIGSAGRDGATYTQRSELRWFLELGRRCRAERCRLTLRTVSLTATVVRAPMHALPLLPIIVSAQVLLETMANELHVNGTDATQLMSVAINQVSLEAADPRLEDLTVTADMLARARIGIVAAHAITSDSAIADLLTDVEGVQTGTGSSTVRTFVLPSDYRSRLSNAILLAAGGSTSVVTTVNDISRDGTQTIGGQGGENRAPTISGTPASSVDVGATYSFTPIASDPDDDPYSFTISGLPSWASFNNATGELSGSPGATGVHTGIVVSVTDGSLSTSLPAFSITVQDPTVNLGSVTLNWSAPTQNEDGTDLTDLDGYKLYWGTTPGSYPNSVTIDDETATSFVVDNLVPGTYEFVATSFNSSGVESRYSAPATKVVP